MYAIFSISSRAAFLVLRNGKEIQIEKFLMQFSVIEDMRALPIVTGVWHVLMLYEYK